MLKRKNLNYEINEYNFIEQADRTVALYKLFLETDFNKTSFAF